MTRSGRTTRRRTIRGILHLVTLGLQLLRVLVTRLATPTFRDLIAFWAFAIAIVTIGRARPAPSAAASSSEQESVGQMVTRLRRGELGVNLMASSTPCLASGQRGGEDLRAG